MSNVCLADPERLEEIGCIQSCGYALAFDEDTRCPSGMRIVCASDNIGEASWIDVSSQTELLGKDLGHAFRAEYVDIVRSLVGRQKLGCEARADRMPTRANRNTADIIPFSPSLAELELGAERGSDTVTLTLASSNPGVYLLEMEQKHGSPGARAGRTLGLLQLADLLRCVPVGSSPKVCTASFCDAFADNMPAYGRTMVYRFAADGTGDVIHENIRPGSGVPLSFLDFRFPAGDIPPRARAQFKAVGARFIVDTSAPTVPISFLHERMSVPNLSKSGLRAPAGCHLRYLRNMGVKASMVAAIQCDGELWGLYVFHSYTAAVHPSSEERIMVEMAAAITSSFISSYEREAAAATAVTLWHVLRRLDDHTRVSDFLSTQYKALLRILDVDSIVLCDESKTMTVYGNEEVSLTQNECADLLWGDESDDTLSYRTLKSKAVAFFSSCSILVAFLREGIARRIKWAGKPDEPRNGEEPIGPRASFDSFIETVAARPETWSRATIDLLHLVHQEVFIKLHAETLPDTQQAALRQASNDLRSTLHGVMGLLEMLETGLDTMGTAEQLDITRAALECGHSMMVKLDNIFRDAKHRNAAEAAAVGRFAAFSPIWHIVHAIGPFAAAQSVDLVAGTDPIVGDVLEGDGDEARIETIVQNLVNIALKSARPNRKVRVDLLVFDSLKNAQAWWSQEAGRFDANEWMVNTATGAEDLVGEPSSAAAKWYVYFVEDSGAGVQPADLAHVLGPYERTSHGALKSFAGTRLGLQICKAHVGAMSGALGIASTFSLEGKCGGTLFAAALPLRPAEPNAVGDTGDSSLGAVPTTPSCLNRIGSCKLVFLVVDDLMMNVKLLTHKIKRYFVGSGAEVEVVTASDGLMALDAHTALRSAEPGGDGTEDGRVLAGVFMDFQLPKLDGIECTKRIRVLEADNGWSRVTICGCTANFGETVRDTFQGAGVDHIVSKPWHNGEVESVCNAMVERTLGGGGRAAREA